ncbi:hypothetical protein CGLO_10978 [Colletotrichum gloeosporioides Cg-14]|uniref:Uncharacterized protein n=1 Tax=Colletotrichum gloeosporioides (strain Cg-14) TaxID=1237896 RepID=T0LD56_COLGC|nr:hypothetical protein CGLO_10978 [Colletotrichum gloeosporioides Cg-14]
MSIAISWNNISPALKLKPPAPKTTECQECDNDSDNWKCLN